VECADGKNAGRMPALPVDVGLVCGMAEVETSCGSGADMGRSSAAPVHDRDRGVILLKRGLRTYGGTEY
jgi:hypothetical protein